MPDRHIVFAGQPASGQLPVNQGGDPVENGSPTGVVKQDPPSLSTPPPLFDPPAVPVPPALPPAEPPALPPAAAPPVPPPAPASSSSVTGTRQLQPHHSVSDA